MLLRQRRDGANRQAISLSLTTIVLKGFFLQWNTGAVTSCLALPCHPPSPRRSLWRWAHYHFQPSGLRPYGTTKLLPARGCSLPKAVSSLCAGLPCLGCTLGCCPCCKQELCWEQPTAQSRNVRGSSGSMAECDEPPKESYGTGRGQESATGTSDHLRDGISKCSPLGWHFPGVLFILQDTIRQTASTMHNQHILHQDADGEPPGRSPGVGLHSWLLCSVQSNPAHSPAGCPRSRHSLRTGEVGPAPCLRCGSS